MKIAIVIIMMITLVLPYDINLTVWHTPPSPPFEALLACLHDQNKSGSFGGPAFFQPIRAFENFSDCSDWLV